MSIFEIIIPKENLDNLLEPCNNRNWGGYYALIIYSILIIWLILTLAYIVIAWIIAKFTKNDNLLEGMPKTYSSKTGQNKRKYTNPYNSGTLCLKNKRYEEAVEYFTAIIDGGYYFPVPIDDIHVLRGIAYSNLGLNTKAKNDFSEALRMFSFDNPTALLERGKIYLREKDYQNALKDFNKAIKMNFSSNGDDFFYRGLLYIQTGEKDKAIKDITKALKLVPKQNKEIREKCEAILQKINNKTLKSEIKETSTEIVKIKTCSKKAILTLDGFDEQKAEQFITMRKQGKIWYDIDSFVMDFNIQPHQMIQIQDRLIFPPKPKVKMGKRKIDI